MAKTWWVPFEGGYIIEADSAEEAREKVNQHHREQWVINMAAKREHYASSEINIHSEQIELYSALRTRRRRQYRQNRDSGSA